MVLSATMAAGLNDESSSLERIRWWCISAYVTCVYNMASTSILSLSVSRSKQKLNFFLLEFSDFFCFCFAMLTF